MVLFPLLIAVGTLGLTMVDSNGNPLIDLSSYSSTSSNSSRSLTNASPSWVFCYGMVMGMGMSSALNYEIKRRRLWERLRVTIFSLVYQSTSTGASTSSDDESSLLDKYRNPTTLDKIDQTPMSDTSSSDQTNATTSPSTEIAPCGVRQVIVSPDWSLTSNMTVTILTLFSGSEVVRQPSPGVEFYYVIRGHGLYLKGNNDNEPSSSSSSSSTNLTAGSCFIVDPACVRGFQAMGQELVLLRATDTLISTNNDATDVLTTTRQDGSVASQSLALVTVGLGKVEALVQQYSPRRRS